MLIGRLVYCALLWLAVVAVAPMIWGWEPTVVVSGSMAPAVRDGDVVVASPANDDGLRPGTVVVYRHRSHGELVAHRIVGVAEDGRFITRGDNNVGVDSTPVARHEVVGVARMVVPWVGLPAHWLRSGRLVELAGFVSVVGASVWLGHRPRRGTGPSRRGRIRRLGFTIAGVFLLTGVAAGSALAAFSAGTHNGGSSFQAGTWGDPLSLYLHDDPSPPTADTASHAALPLSSAPPLPGVLYNYDTDRDPAPGLRLEKGGSFGGGDPARAQLWQVTPAADLTFAGPTTLSLWAAPEGFATNRRGYVHARLYDCDGGGGGCITIGAAAFESRPWSPTGTWTLGTLDFGMVSHTISAGRMLRLEVVLDRTSDAMWFAYDTAAYPSVLSSG